MINILTSKQRATLRRMANGETVVVHIGKGGINENVVKSAADALKTRELIKCSVLESALLTAREAAEALAELTASEQVQIIGSKFVLFKRNAEKPRIEL